MSDVQLRKAELRARLLARRSALDADQRTAAGRLIRDAVLAAPQVQMAGTIAAYYSIGAEPDTHGLVYALWKRGSYDRALARVGPLVPLIALVYDDELVEHVPAEGHDIPVRATASPRAGITVTGAR